MSGVFSLTGEGLVLRVQVIPKSAHEEIVGIIGGPNQRRKLKLKVRAAPEKGRANKAVCSLLAKTLGLPKSNFEVISGPTSGIKTVQISGDGRVLANKLKTVLAGL